jgi:hypothetical protein
MRCSAHPLAEIYERSAIGPNAPAPPSLTIFALRASRIFGWWLRGLGRPTPFFDDHTNAPLSVPRVLTPSERAALLNIDDLLKLGRLHDGQIGGLGAPEDKIDVRENNPPTAVKYRSASTRHPGAACDPRDSAANCARN